MVMSVQDKKIACTACGMQGYDFSMMEHRAIVSGEPVSPCLDGGSHKFGFVNINAFERYATVAAHQTLQ